MSNTRPTSQINYSTISTTYPVAGQDNNSQGFRDNFTNISAAIAQAKVEIQELLNNAVIVADLPTGSQAQTNDLLGSTLRNGLYSQFNGIYVNGGTVTTSANIDLSQGPMQQFTAGGDITLTFTNWPTTQQFAMVRVMLIGDQIQTRKITLSTSNGGLIKLATGWVNKDLAVSTSLPATLQLNNTGGLTVIEAWTVNTGSTVYLKQIGTY